jgi:hypothetical protein
MKIFFEILAAFFVGWASSAMLLEMYESHRPLQKNDEDNLADYNKRLSRAKNKCSAGFGLFAAVAWLFWHL